MSKLLDGFSVSGDFDFCDGAVLHAAVQLDGGADCGGRDVYAAAGPGVWDADPGEWIGLLTGSTRRLLFRPANGFGTASRNSIEGPGTVSVDTSFSRTVSLGETRSFEARVTANNVFQHGAVLGDRHGAELGDVWAGDVGTAAQRTLLFTARYRF